jgi:flagellar protein FlaG
MTEPISALNASARSEPVETASPAPKPHIQTERLRATTQLAQTEREKKTDETSAATLTSAVAEINKSLKLASIGVQFEFDREAKTMVTKVIDVDSGELIRQMPSEEVVRISKAIGQLQGFLLSQKV